MPRKRTIRRPDDSAASREHAILSAAGSVFLERGYDAATTLEIARRAKTSKRALYELYGSKQAMLAAMIRAVSGRMTAPLDLPPPATRQEFLMTLERFGAPFLGALLHPHRTALYRLAIGEAMRSGDIARELDFSGHGPVREAVLRHFRLGAEKGFVNLRDIDVLATTFFSVLIGSLQIQCLLGIEPAPSADVLTERSALAVSIVEKLSRGARK